MRLFSLCTFVRFETIIWLTIRFNISLQKAFRHFLTARHYGILFMKMFYNVVISIVCCAKRARASIVLTIEWVGICLKNCEKLQLCQRSVWLKKKKRLIVLFTSGLMYKKYKKLVYTPPDLLPRFFKVNLSNTKSSALFFIFASLLEKGKQPINYNA